MSGRAAMEPPKGTAGERGFVQAGKVAQATLRGAFEAIGARAPASFAVRFADGSEYASRAEPPVATLVFRTPRAEQRTLLFGHIGLLESHFDGEVDLDGDLNAAVRVALESRSVRHGGANLLVRMRNRAHELTRSNRTREQARANARFHYGLGVEFFRQWLDHPYLMYTCAYWKEGTTSLEQAQVNKMEHVCRKLRLASGENIVDIGCGWGGFLRYAHERHGVIGVGINTTTEQVEEGNAELARLGLADKLRILEADLRDVQGEFDKCVSIGVLEHAGRDQLLEAVQAHAASLRPGGLGMLHFIGHVGRFETEYWIREHIFPGGWIPSLAETIEAMEGCGLEILDIENLRRNYALTLDAWTERFDANWERIHALDPARFDERFRRKWRFYLVSCAEMFRSPAGYTHLFQILYSRGNVTQELPLSREYMYR
jgi:cyclopropane-fatty-acyl-phospholipid synthase